MERQPFGIVFTPHEFEWKQTVPSCYIHPLCRDHVMRALETCIDVQRAIKDQGQLRPLAMIFSDCNGPLRGEITRILNQVKTELNIVFEFVQGNPYKTRLFLELWNSSFTSAISME